MSLRVQFAHGLEGSPQGYKARLLTQHFDTCIPAMDTSDLSACVAQHAAELVRFRPQVLVGSSFGGAVAMELLARGLYKGPTLLLAQAAVKLTACRSLPQGVRVCLVHATDDGVVPVQDSRLLAATGTVGLIELIEVQDDHGLGRFTTSGQLLQTVRRLHGSDC